MYAATATKKVACDMYTLFTSNSTQKGIQIRTPNRSSTVNCSFATWAREETRNSLLCKSLKLLSSCRLSWRFTFAPRLLFHAARSTVHQADRYAAEIMQIEDGTWNWRTKAERISPNKLLQLGPTSSKNGFDLFLESA